MSSMGVPILRVAQQWYCPNCHLTDVTTEARPHTRFHSCPGLHGLTAPMLPSGTKAKVTAHEREDYIGNEIVQTDNRGRPVMSVVTTRDDGTDAIVFAPTATVKGN